MKRTLSLRQNVGGQVSLAAVLAMVTGMEGLAPWQKLVGVLVVAACMVAVSIWAHHSEPPPKPQDPPRQK